VSKHETEWAVVPIENSLEGGVTETYDLLLNSELKVTGEIKFRIRHCLIAKPNSTLKGIRRVLSHPQALAQCRKNLEKLGLVHQPFYDTAGSVKFVADSSDSSLAAIAGRRSAKVYDMKVLKTDMEDSKTNYTRFLILGKRALSRVRGYTKTSLIFSTKHRPGSLFEALQPFAKQGINLTKIESRPTKQIPWEYYFYLDFDGSTKDEGVHRAIEELRKRVDLVKILGSYPRAK
jgi:prephenate dehydratase